MNLLLTCATTPDFSPEALALWNHFCIADWMPGEELIQYLLFAPAAEYACIDAIVFLEPHAAVGFGEWPDGTMAPIPLMTPWEAHYYNAEISQRIRSLPESCAMRDGRKWKRIPQIVATKHGRRYEAYDGLDVEFVIDVTEMMLYSGYASPITWERIERIVNQYHRDAFVEYERVGFLVICDHGLYRVKRAYRKKSSNESEFYFGGKDKRRFHGFVTVGRDQEGIDYEALLFEQVLNDPRTGERQIHAFFEEHPDLLAEAMMGNPISHQPQFPTNRQTPDFSISPILPRDSGDWVKILELKGPHASVLDHRRRLHRALAPAVHSAIAQVRDYEESIRDPINLRAIEKSLGYIPKFSDRAVLIGRNPAKADSDLWDKRREEQLGVRIITYDDVLQRQRSRRDLRRRSAKLLWENRPIIL